MSNENNGRVLNRMGARLLTEKEMEQITGASGPFTHASRTATGNLASPDTDMDS
jgi:hypothetical protein